MKKKAKVKGHEKPQGKPPGATGINKPIPPARDMRKKSGQKKKLP